MSMKKSTRATDRAAGAAAPPQTAARPDIAHRAAASPPARPPREEVSGEAAEWDERRRTPVRFEDAWDAVPRTGEATAISIRMPAAVLSLLKKFAEQEGVGYQVLIKRWLDDRLRLERDRMRAVRRDGDAAGQGARRGRTQRAPGFPLVDRAGDGGHYQPGDR